MTERLKKNSAVTQMPIEGQGSTASVQTIDEEAVINYLRMRPDFFVDKPDLLRLQKISAPGSQETVSLQDRQVGLLRQQVTELETHIRTLASAARDNEKLLQRWHELTLNLLQANNLDDFFNRLEERLRQDYAAEYVVLKLLRVKLQQTVSCSSMVTMVDTPMSASLNELLASPEAWCGRLTAAKNSALFDDKKVASAVVVAIAPYGLLAIGSQDVERFAPGTGVLFIELLAKTIRWQLDQPSSTENVVSTND